MDELLLLLLLIIIFEAVKLAVAPDETPVVADGPLDEDPVTDLTCTFSLLLL